jgi:hypothetical protein
MLDLAFARGFVSGRNFGCALLKPACATTRPRCPYWCPAKWLVWRLAFSIGLHDALDLK